MGKQITVIGCGVIGLCSGIRLLEKGYNVRIVARDLPPNTTSNWAAAIWLPFKVYPRDLALRWGAATFDVLLPLIDEPSSGVMMTTLFELSAEPLPPPWWQSAVNSYRHAATHELPSGYTDAYVVDLPLMDTGIYLDYLVNQFKTLGGTIEQRELAPADLDTLGPIVINCSGLGSHKLVDDSTVYPIRGQVMLTEKTGLDVSYIDVAGPNGLAHIFPRTHDMVLGGIAVEHDWSEEVDEAVSAEIIRKINNITPHASQTIIRQGVGLRPGRPSVRLEAETLPSGTYLIHNYGHGGAGFTLSWGCADDVAALIP